MNEKITIRKMGNNDRFNEIEIDKSEVFLDNLQDLLVDIGLADADKLDYEFEGKNYDLNTYYTLLYEDPKNDFEVRKLRIDEFHDGLVERFFNQDIELLVIFLKDRIKLIFYCDKINRHKIIQSLMKFCEFMKVKAE